MLNKYVTAIILAAAVTFSACYYPPPNTVRVVRYTDNTDDLRIRTYLSRAGAAYSSGNQDDAMYWYWMVLKIDRNNEIAISRMVSLLEKRIEKQGKTRPAHSRQDSRYRTSQSGRLTSPTLRARTSQPRTAPEPTSTFSKPATETSRERAEVNAKSKTEARAPARSETAPIAEATVPSAASSTIAIASPIQGRLQITSAYGARRPAGRIHRGVDIRANRGTPVLASLNGRVIYAGWSSGYGYNVRIEGTIGGTRIQTRYAHLSNVSVRRGAYVRKGDVIGRIGATGNATGPHLHYEVLVNGSHVDPARFLQ